MKKKAIHYLNQFFGQVGGEDMADYEPAMHDGALGCSNIFNAVSKNGGFNLQVQHPQS